MRLFITADLHFGHSIEGNKAAEKLAAHVVAEGQPNDVLILAGDQGTGMAGLMCLSLFDRFAGTKLAVLGNHDIWTTSGADADSRELYERLLPTAYREQSGFHLLDQAPATVGDTAFVGNMGWYDYSLRDRSLGFSDEAYRTKVYPGHNRPMWMDAVRVKWDYSDEEMADLLARRLEAQLNQPEVRRAHRTIAILHHVPTSRLLSQPRFLVPRVWRFANTFLGSEVYRQVIERHRDNVRLTVCGHIHGYKSVTMNGQRYVSVGSTYDSKQLFVVEGETIHRFNFR